MSKKQRIAKASFKAWVVRASVKIPSTPIPTFTALWFASAPIARISFRRLGRSGRKCADSGGSEASRR